MKNILEVKLTEILKSQLDKGYFMMKHQNKTKIAEQKFEYSENVRNKLNLLKPNIEESKEDIPRPERTIGKESQRKGKGRGCM